MNKRNTKSSELIIKINENDFRLNDRIEWKKFFNFSLPFY